METRPIQALLNDAPGCRQAAETLTKGRGPLTAVGVPTAQKLYYAAALCRTQTVLYVVSDEAAAQNALEALSVVTDDARLFPYRDMPLTHMRADSGDGSRKRIAVMTRLLSGERTLLVCPSAALMQRMAPPDAFGAMLYRIRTGDAVEPRALLERLARAGYARTELVEGRGQTAARGDIVDVFPPQSKWPVRIEFFGDEVDQMRLFDPVTQRSVEQLTEALLPPAFETPQTPDAIAHAYKAIAGKDGLIAQQEAWEQGMPCAGGDVLVPLLYRETAGILSYLPKDAVLLLDEPTLIDEAMRVEELRFNEAVTAMLERGEGAPEQGWLECGAAEAFSALHTNRTMAMCALMRGTPLFRTEKNLPCTARSAPQYMANFDELAHDVARWRQNGERVVLFAGEHAARVMAAVADAGEVLPVRDALTGLPQPGEPVIVRERMPLGVAYPEQRLTVLTEHELFGKVERPVSRGKKKNVLQFSELKVGDYIVHEAHGIGRFVKVEPLTVDQKTRDYLLIEYKGGDRLYIPTDQLDRIQKYLGGGDEDVIPPLSKLGGSDWTSRVNRAKSAAKKLAVDLAALYAARACQNGFAFSADTSMQKLFEERFPYQETPDQLTSIREIKADMEQTRPMDRLLCGDVGYGKTEVAMRAVFKAVQDNKQAALLVPTTILAQQHYHTMEARFADFPVKVACLSRFQQANERKQILRALAAGEIDVIVGTHALLSKEVRFHDLGLLVIDEEHRFGVNHKEQMKAMRQTVDVLTLTATPIPRTLNMSLSGIRDISVIETPPEERYPVQTYVLEYTDAILKDAIARELGRGGQAYVVFNRVQSMEWMARHIAELLPDVRVIIAHGQMGETQLENAMLDFMEKRGDVLLCSTIIESGLDIPNVNTMVVIDADRMGLAQLYQLRGRVGRSSRLGYAYLTVPAAREMNEKAAKRLMAIREFTQFGAGFQLAMRDLEIRGAGSLLGAEQHGHISEVGFEYYTKLVRRAVDEAQGKPVENARETSVDIPLDAHIPHGYIASEMQRLRVYRRIADIDGLEAKMDVTEELIDRYGEPPAPVENLMRIALIKAYAARAWLESVHVRDGLAELRFAADAPIDGARLLAAVSGTAGAQLVASETPGVRIRQKNDDAERMAELLAAFLPQLAGCVAADEA